MLQASQINQFQQLILSWYQENQRDLPWRTTHDPYAVLVSEVMLQQTQVDRVLKHYSGWISRWPTFDSLASAGVGEAIRAWKGLGYNRRSVNLHRTAVQVTTKLNGEFPNSLKGIDALPGIGEGTAGALMNFVWNIDTPFLEVNLRRIFQRLAFGPETIIGWASDKELQSVAETVLPTGYARVWPHALMDFGALACRPNDPFCENCPLGELVGERNISLENRPALIVERKSKIRFEETNRYWRGRILDLLRENDLSVNQLNQKMPTDPALGGDRLRNLLNGLGKDGLLVRKQNVLSLP